MTNDYAPFRRLCPLLLPPLLALAGCSNADDSAEGETAQAASSGDGDGFTSDSGPGGTSGAPPSGSGSDPSGGGDSDSDGSPTGTGADTSDEPPDDSGDSADGQEESGSSSTGEPLECDDQTEVELFLSPDDSNSMSSPVQVRNAVLGGWGSIYGTPIRTWEFLNYYRFGYAPAEPGELALHTSLLHDDDMEEGEYKLQIAISSPTMDNDDRAPMNLTLVLDESGSMAGTPMDMQIETCRVIASSLRAGDVVSMVGWDTSNATIIGGHTVSGPDDPVLLQAIDGLTPGGGTDLNGGLVAGYALAAESYDPARINRIVLISDGGANAGVTDQDLIAEHAGSNDEDGIYMVGVGVGDAGYNDELMDRVTDIGKGASVFINSADEAQRVFGTDFLSTMAVAARDVQVRLDMPPGFEIVKFSGEEFSTNPDEVEPQHLAPNDAMVFHQSIATCAPELLDDTSEITVTARFKDGTTFEAQEVTRTVTFGELLAHEDALLLKGAAVFSYAESLKAFRDEDDAEALETALESVARAQEALPGDPDLVEIRTVLEAL